MKYYIICIIAVISVNAFSQVQQNEQHKSVNIKGVNIDLENIPYDRPTNVNLKKSDVSVNKSKPDSIANSKSATNYKLFVSMNKRFINFSSTRNTNEESFSTDLESYDNSGKLLWKTSKNLDLYECKISEDGKYTHAFWENPFTDEIFLISYDLTGKELKKIKDIKRFISNGIGDIIYYEMKTDNSKTFGCLNFRDNVFWEKTSPVMSVIRAVASETGDVIISSDHSMISYNPKGEISWEKSFENLNGFLDLSSDGKYFIWIPDIGKVRVFKNSNCKIVYSTDNLIYHNESSKFVFGNFIENTNLIYLCDYSSDKTKFIITELSGKVVIEITVNKMFQNTFKIFCPSKNEFNIYFDGIFVQSNKLD